MLELEKYAAAAINEQRRGKQQRGGPMGVYANGAALRAMAAVEQVHLVVVSTFTGPSASKKVNKFKGHGCVRKGCPLDRVAVYPPNEGKPLRRIKSWANDIVPVLLRRAVGVAARVTRRCPGLNAFGVEVALWLRVDRLRSRRPSAAHVITQAQHDSDPHYRGTHTPPLCPFSALSRHCHWCSHMRSRRVSR